MWTVNFQMFRLVLEKAQEPEIKLPTSAGSSKKQESSRKTSISALLTVKKAEHQKIDAFEMWCWRRLLRVPWTARRSNQSILKEISPGCSLEGLMLKLKLQYFGHLIQRTASLEKIPWCWERLKAVGEGDKRGWDGWMASPTRWTCIWASSGSWWWTGKPRVLQSMWSQRVRHDWGTELNWIREMKRKSK